jgi:hypothetical protein
MKLFEIFRHIIPKTLLKLLFKYLPNLDNSSKIDYSFYNLIECVKY